jgi:hypothetical protein
LSPLRVLSTGGWPLLVDRAAELAAQLGSQEAALKQLEQQLADPTEAAKFLEAAGRHCCISGSSRSGRLG